MYLNEPFLKFWFFLSDKFDALLNGTVHFKYLNGRQFIKQIASILLWRNGLIDKAVCFLQTANCITMSIVVIDEKYVNLISRLEKIFFR